jgi:DNA-binding transcriptional ArsR family regulator
MVVHQLNDGDVDRLFHALADATRRDIVRRSVDGTHSVSDLARRYPMSLTAVQKHVGVLEEAGLVTKHRHGREQRVVARPEAFGLAQALLNEYEALWLGRLERMGELLDENPGGTT